MTEPKNVEEQLRQSHKIATISRLVGGVAHDLNNLLTIINSCSDILLTEHPGDASAQAVVSQISKAGGQAARLTQQLLVLSRRKVLEPRVLNLNDSVKETEWMLRRLIGEAVELTSDLDADLDLVKAAPRQIDQVLMNLAVNARDAMPKGGKLMIKTANIIVDETNATMHSEVRPGRYVLLAMSDTGCGITPEVRARVFEPFFTTKGPGKGTGLGLAIVQDIVKQSGGHIAVSSEPGGGTTFEIYLPCVTETRGTLKSHLGRKTVRRGEDAVLLVEGEENVREVLDLGDRKLATQDVSNEALGKIDTRFWFEHGPTLPGL
jgi:two-component system, cell cycle sensor histidine kinase and response regulator CckA